LAQIVILGAVILKFVFGGNFMKFEVIKYIPMIEGESFNLFVLRELSTDFLWIRHTGILLEMQNSETKLPITYEEWKDMFDDIDEFEQFHENDHISIEIDFEKIGCYADFIVLKEKSTEIMYIYTSQSPSNSKDSDLTIMRDPENGESLTYTTWIEKYKQN